jgi:regulatory protein YycI of two-component signal transduction system YycFG
LVVDPETGIYKRPSGKNSIHKKTGYKISKKYDAFNRKHSSAGKLPSGQMSPPKSAAYKKLENNYSIKKKNLALETFNRKSQTMTQRT